MQHRHPRLDARPTAMQALLGEPGVSGTVLVLLATGVGLLLDFQVTGLHPIFSVGLALLSVPATEYWSILKVLKMNSNRSRDVMRNIALATVAGQAGCSTLVLVFLALFGGMYLDAQLNTHPLFTVGLLLLSIPISLFSLFRMVLSAVARITPPSPPASPTTQQAVKLPQPPPHSEEKSP